MSEPYEEVVEELLEELIDTCSTVHLDETFPMDVKLSETIHEEVDASSDAYCDETGGCAICLEQIPFEDLAIIKGCEHSYCACCILKWVTFHRDAPRCPQCKSHFNYLYTYRCLDGTFCDHFVEESVTLLLRARWFQGKLPAMEDPCEELSEDEDEDYDSYYLSPHNRVVLGNRRFGANGVISNGRQHAVPRRQPPAPTKPPATESSSSKAKGKERAERGEAKAVSAKKAQRDAKKELKANKEAQKAAQRKAARMQKGPTKAEPAADVGVEA